MAKNKDFIDALSDRSLLILTLYEKLGSIEALREALPEITDKDLTKCTREAEKAMKIYNATEGGKVPKKKASKSVGAYQLKIALRGSKPPIWRRVIVPEDITLAKLHVVIQVAMGWDDGHLHEFTIDGTAYSGTAPDGSMLEDMDGEDETEYQLGEVLREKMKFEYLYDFGDSWEHVITVEKIIPSGDKRPVTACTAGKLHCPLEDCGGLWGYYEKLKIITDKKHREHAALAQWIGENFDSEAFDIQAVNKTLAAMKL
ncbi:MAG: plasmid pRiA4b ORF-3 family protein [Phycisphaerae bacterium]